MLFSNFELSDNLVGLSARRTVSLTKSRSPDLSDTTASPS